MSEDTLACPCCHGKGCRLCDFAGEVSAADAVAIQRMVVKFLTASLWDRFLITLGMKRVV